MAYTAMATPDPIAACLSWRFLVHSHRNTPTSQQMGNWERQHKREGGRECQTVSLHGEASGWV
jgi:hypothetical protein